MYKDSDSTFSNEGGTIPNIDQNFFRANDIIPNKYVSLESFDQVKFSINTSIYFFLVDAKPQKIDWY